MNKTAVLITLALLASCAFAYTSMFEKVLPTPFAEYSYSTDAVVAQGNTYLLINRTSASDNGILWIDYLNSSMVQNHVAIQLTGTATFPVATSTNSTNVTFGNTILSTAYGPFVMSAGHVGEAWGPNLSLYGGGSANLTANHVNNTYEDNIVSFEAETNASIVSCSTGMNACVTCDIVNYSSLHGAQSVKLTTYDSMSHTCLTKVNLTTPYSYNGGGLKYRVLTDHGESAYLTGLSVILYNSTGDIICSLGNSTIPTNNVWTTMSGECAGAEDVYQIGMQVATGITANESTGVYFDVIADNSTALMPVSINLNGVALGNVSDTASDAWVDIAGLVRGVNNVSANTTFTFADGYAPIGMSFTNLTLAYDAFASHNETTTFVVSNRNSTETNNSITINHTAFGFSAYTAYLNGVSLGAIGTNATPNVFTNISGAQIANGVNNLTLVGVGNGTVTSVAASYRQTVSTGQEINTSSLNYTDMYVVYGVKYNGTAAGDITVKKANGTTLMSIASGADAPTNSFVVCPEARGCSIKSFIYSNDYMTRYRWKQYDVAGTAYTARTIYNAPGANDKFVPITFKQGETVELYATGYVASSNSSIGFDWVK